MKKLLVIIVLFIILATVFLYVQGGKGIPKIRQYFLGATPAPTEMPIEEISGEELISPTTTPTLEAPAAEGQLPASGLGGD